MFCKSRSADYFSYSDSFRTSSLAISDLSRIVSQKIRSELHDAFFTERLFRASTSTALLTPDPGNTRATAYNIGALGSSPVSLSDSVGNTDRNDFYQFSVGSTVNFNLVLTGMTADADVQLLSAGGAVLQSSTNPRNLDESITRTLNAGTYYVRVYQYSGNTNYTLTLSAAGSTSSFPAPAGFNSTYGYGLVDASAAVAGAIGQSPFPAVANLGGNNWNLDQINAPEVWARGYTGQGVVVAVIDTGVDYTHPDLSANIWINTREIPGNGIDDDGNGFIDDIRGWDFVQRDNTPTDPNGHGTHVAGTIAAVNNSFGATGVAYNAQIMPVRVLDANGSGNSANIAAGIRYAVNNGADVINLSLGGGFSSDIQAAIQYATQLGAMVVMASGNESQSQPGYPARLATQYGIAVGAVDRNNKVAGFSNSAGSSPLNYVVAPGVSVYSTTPNNTYRSYSGTSMATPHVAGVAALILSANPNLSPAEVTTLLAGTANPNRVTV
ncbi:S8 family serine peptidase [Leptothermofonsia sichuanensis E412]|uniref:S8 family serine peptidase n=1 Tax=Leptothermofonsia sichuanensis TaxID=2917832 RepID=UPI001CA66376|nr:S8 family serine peptidase [Leptothermofonsia sichuanensis]QZZ20986.1 S8 family serine peptidase [Leptothermofonsia sichuanensis E412]